MFLHVDSQFFQNHLLSKWPIFPHPSVAPRLACTGSHAPLALSPFHGWVEPSLGQCQPAVIATPLLALSQTCLKDSWTSLYHIAHLWIPWIVQSRGDLRDYSGLMDSQGRGAKRFSGLWVWSSGKPSISTVCSSAPQNEKTLPFSHSLSPLNDSSLSILQL